MDKSDFLKASLSIVQEVANTVLNIIHELIYTYIVKQTNFSQVSFILFAVW